MNISGETAISTVNNELHIAQEDSAFTDAEVLLDSENVLNDNGNGEDTDPNNDPLTVTAVNGNSSDIGQEISLPSGALLTLNSDGTYSYDPNGQYESLGLGETATDSFTYTISDGNGGTSQATVTITINGRNDPPVAENDSNSTDADVVLENENVLNDNGNGEDTDPDSNDTLVVTEVNGNSSDIGQEITLPSGALLTLNSDGTYSYDPNGQYDSLLVGETATDNFTYTISDGNGGTSTATVTITVNGQLEETPTNNPPVAEDDSAITDADVVLENENVLVGDTDPDNDPLTVTEVNGNSSDIGQEITLPSGALLTLNSDGTYSYNPNGQYDSLLVGETATDNFTYTISDGNGGTSTATVTITVNGQLEAPPTNNPPVAENDSAITDADVVLENENVLVGDTDPYNDPLSVTEVNGNSSDIGQEITLPSGALLTLR
ncbi:MAG: tandem-95 repeat protein [Okeania sp. SIO2F4]|uniref:Ig-like domain-containing protein n=1 Tax=Okeania sp. SIO2F4 TaxID=2607790 RepID=UPI00142C5A57|nr:Ig-like domain-containing protein [Okeania sp. SIO2F4]NES04703.1 tandem-95 repeat protein [Okeania sp. SIO2F4]